MLRTMPSASETVAIEPGPVRAGDAAAEVGHGGDHRRPALGRHVAIGAIIAVRVEMQISGSAQSRDATIA